MRTLATVIFFCVSTLIFQHCRAEFDKTNDKKADLTGKTSVEKHGKLSVSGSFLVNEKNEKVVLKGVSFGWHNWWPRFYNEGAVGTFASDWNCSVVRAAMGVTPQGGYLSDPQLALDCVTRVVDAAIKNGKFQGIICPTTPIGSRNTSDKSSSSNWFAVPSSPRITPAK